MKRSGIAVWCSALIKPDHITGFTDEIVGGMKAEPTLTPNCQTSCTRSNRSESLSQKVSPLVAHSVLLQCSLHEHGQPCR